MADIPIFLYAGEANPNDIKLSDPTVQRSSGGAITANASIIESDDALVSTGVLTIVAIASITEGNDSVSGSGSLNIVAVADITEADDTISGNSFLSIIGSLTIQEADDILSGGAMLVITGSLEITDENDSISSGAAIDINAGLSLQEANDILEATGYFENATSDNSDGALSSSRDRKKRDSQRMLDMSNMHQIERTISAFLSINE